MKRILSGIVGLLLLAPTVALAQPAASALAEVVTSCNAKTYTVGDQKPLSQTTGGGLCNGGGSAGTVTIAGGADVTEGTIGDTQATGTVVGFLKSIWSIFNATPPATSALQTTGNTSLSTIATNTTSLVSGIITTETGRVPTNLISGQAGVAGGSGASGANTQRVITSTDSTVGLQAAETHAGEVGGNMLPITNAMTTTNATITTGQSIGGLQTLTSAVRVSGALGAGGTSGIIQDALVTFKDAVGAGPLDIYFFNANPSGSTCTNASSLVLADADRTKMIGIAHVTDFTASNTAAVGQAHNLAMTFGLSSATSMYACVVARASFAITSTANAALQVNILRN